ncbi:MAG: MarR family winged helix-turn-helix transcriptional regulator [Oricola sp.]
MDVLYETMTRISDDETFRAWARLVRAQSAVMSSVENALKSAGLPPLSWYDALLEIERVGEGGIRPFELEKQLLLPQYGLSRLLSRLEDTGYVGRRPSGDDGRGHRVVITAEGRKIRLAMWPVYSEAVEKSFARHMTGDEAQKLAEILGRIVAGNRPG